MLRAIAVGANMSLLTVQRHLSCQTHLTDAQRLQLNNMSSFKFKSRAEHVADVKRDPAFDLLIIGGGITGSACLLDASRKDLRALLIDSNDFAAGSSSKSTKLLHGGLRYLENAFKPMNRNRGEDFHLVQEALNERNLTLNVAPHLAKPIGIVVPTTNIFGCAFYYVGCLVYQNFERVYAFLNRKADPFTRHLPFQLPRPRVMFREEMHRMFPSLNSSFKYGVLMWDGQVDDSRLVVEAVLTATSLQHPGLRQNAALNFCRLVEFEKNPNGRITGAVLEDKLTKEQFKVRAKVAINATGHMADRVRSMANPSLPKRIMASKGDHVTLDNSVGQLINHADENVGLLIPKTKDGRLMFVLPWKKSVIAGTTDKPVENPVINALPDPESTEEILASVKGYFEAADLKPLSRWAGFRPLVITPPKDVVSPSTEIDLDKSTASSKVDTKDIKRTHVVELDEKSGLISVMGGKLTISRVMGEDGVKMALVEMKQHHGLSEQDYAAKLDRTTRNLRFMGDYRAKLFDLDRDLPENSLGLSIPDRPTFLDVIQFELQRCKVKLDPDVIDYLAQTYGHRALVISKKFEANPQAALRLDARYPFTKGEIEHIWESELVATPAELLTNRLRLAFLDASEAKRLLPVVIDVYGDCEKWSDDRKRQEMHFNQELLARLSF